MDYIVTLSDEEEKALLTDMISIQAWLNNAIHNRARIQIDRIVEQVSDKQPGKISIQEKLRIVAEADIKSAAERQAEMEA